ncbi:MAG: copper chaperone PCu(A)C [Alphaproteobacteria bacterium]
MKLFAAAALSLLFVATAGAENRTVGNVTISDPWVRAAKTQTSAAYVMIDNKGTAKDRLIGASSPAADRVELHTTEMDGDVARMKKLDGIELPPGQHVMFRPGGMHIMLIGVKRPLEEGQSIKLTLQFEKAGNVELDVAVRKGPPMLHKH